MRITSKRKIHNTEQVNKFTCLEFKSQCVLSMNKICIFVYFTDSQNSQFLQLQIFHLKKSNSVATVLCCGRLIWSGLKLKI